MTYITKDLQDVLSKHNVDVRLSETISYLPPSEAKRVRRENQEKLRLLVDDSKKMEQICDEYYAVIQNIVPYEQKLIKKDTRALSELMKFQAETLREKVIARNSPDSKQVEDRKKYITKKFNQLPALLIAKKKWRVENPGNEAFQPLWLWGTNFFFPGIANELTAIDADWAVKMYYKFSSGEFTELSEKQINEFAMLPYTPANIERISAKFREVVEKMKKYTVTLEARPFNDEVSSMLFHHIRENGKLALKFAKDQVPVQKKSPDVMLGENFAIFLSKEMKQPLIKKNITVFAQPVEDGVQILLMDLIKKGKIAELAKEYGGSSHKLKLVNTQINNFFDLFGGGAHRLFTKALGRDYDSIRKFVEAILRVQSQLIKANSSSEKKEEASYISTILNTIKKMESKYGQEGEFLQDIFSEKTYTELTPTVPLKYGTPYYDASIRVMSQYGFLRGKKGKFFAHRLSPFRRLLLLRSFFKQAKILRKDLTKEQKENVTSHIVGVYSYANIEGRFERLEKAIGVLGVNDKKSIHPFEFMFNDNGFDQVKIGGNTSDQLEFEKKILPARYDSFSDSYKMLHGKYSGVPHDNSWQVAFKPVVKGTKEVSQAHFLAEKLRHELSNDDKKITGFDVDRYFSAVEASQGVVKIGSNYVSALLTETNQIIKKSNESILSSKELRELNQITDTSKILFELLKHWFKNQKEQAMNALRNIG